MNKVYSVFANEDSLVEVPYFGPSFWKVLISSPRFPSLMAYIWMIWKMQGAICYVLWYVLYEDVMCYVQYNIYNNACYSHGMTFLTQFGKFTNFPNLNLTSLLTRLPKIMSLGKSCSFSCMSLACACIYLYLVQVCTNRIQLYYFRCRTRKVIEL